MRGIFEIALLKIDSGNIWMVLPTILVKHAVLEEAFPMAWRMSFQML